MFNFSFPKNTTFSNPSNNFDVVNSSVDTITSNIHPCKYHNSFIYPQNKSNTTKIFFSLIHFNIRSLQKNFDSLHEFLSRQQSSPDIICLSETRLKEQPLININIRGYSFIHIDSPTNAGGVAMHISTTIQHSILTEVQMDTNGCENIWRKIKDSNVIIGTIYRHPKNDLRKFIIQLNTSLEKITTQCI